jgi:hypothetical protein
MDQAAFLIELADDLRELLSRSAGQNDCRTLIPKASGCYGAMPEPAPVLGGKRRDKTRPAARSGWAASRKWAIDICGNCSSWARMRFSIIASRTKTPCYPGRRSIAFAIMRGETTYSAAPA